MFLTIAVILARSNLISSHIVSLHLILLECMLELGYMIIECQRFWSLIYVLDTLMSIATSIGMIRESQQLAKDGHMSTLLNAKYNFCDEAKVV